MVRFDTEVAVRVGMDVLVIVSVGAAFVLGGKAVRLFFSGPGVGADSADLCDCSLYSKAFQARIHHLCVVAAVWQGAGAGPW